MDDLFDETASDKPLAWHRTSAIDPATGKKTIESKPAHDAFRIYCQQQGRRSLRNVAQELHKSVTLLGRWSVRWNWQERVRAYDHFVDEVETVAFLSERKAMAKRQARIGVLGQNIATAGLVQIQEQLQAAGQQRPLKIHELARLLDVSAKLERTNRGEHDPDAVASIIVHIERQTSPRYETEGKKFDA